MSRARWLARVAASVALASPYPAFAQADGAVWTYNSYVADGATEPTHYLTFGIPETDAIAFTASCGGGTEGPAIPVMLSVDFGEASDGTPTIASVQSDTYRADLPAQVRIESDESAGLALSLADQDPLWGALATDSMLSFAMFDRPPTTVPLAGATEPVTQFVQACRAAFAATEGAATDNFAYDYSCEDGTSFRAEFDNSGADSVATLTLPSGLVRLQQQPAGSGVLYAGGDYSLHTKADDAVFGQSGKPDTNCKAAE